MQEKHSSSRARRCLVYGLVMLLLQSVLLSAAQSTPVPGLPATNDVGVTRVVLERVRAVTDPPSPIVELSLKSSALHTQPLGWLLWDVAIKDEVGKTIKSSHPRRVEGVLSTNGFWDIVLRGKEFIGGDHMDLPAEAEFRNCVLKPRALDYGLKNLVFLGKGYYKIRDGKVIDSGLNPNGLSSFDLNENGDIQVYTSDPAVFLVYDPARAKIPLNARLRERPLKSAGVPFEPKTTSRLTCQSLDLELHAQLHTFKNRTAAPITTNKVEVEVVATLPEITFRTPAVVSTSRTTHP